MDGDVTKRGKQGRRIIAHYLYIVQYGHDEDVQGGVPPTHHHSGAL